MALEFRISTGSSTPVYRQIVDQVRKAVVAGTIEVGEQLPSVRALAELLVINPNTVARAYGELAREGVIEAQAGKGLFVAPRRQIFSAEERQRRLHNALDSFLNEVMLLDFSPAEIVKLLEQKLAELNGLPVNAPSTPPLSKTPQSSVAKLLGRKAAKKEVVSVK